MAGMLDALAGAKPHHGIAELSLELQQHVSHGAGALHMPC
jgi:hypothetical protein